MDVLTKEERRHTMQAIKGKNTKPEMIVRSYLFKKGLRYRVNVKKLPGTPDIVLKKWRCVVFVNGCFWHGHNGCFILPQTNTEFWKNKIERNINRDRENIHKLEAMGWRVIVVWECEIRKKERRKERLDELYLEIVSGKAE
ncbi:MAG: very short patch repair endonuclease [Candidatus Ornithospirochaeta sp.]